MGQVQSSWCREGFAVNSDLNVWPVRGDVEHVARHKDGQLAEDELPEEAEWLLAGLPRELADVLRDTGQWVTLRCRPWLSAGAFRGLQRSLQRCQLRQLAERDALVTQSFEEKERHAREAEELRKGLLQQQQDL